MVCNVREVRLDDQAGPFWPSVLTKFCIDYYKVVAISKIDAYHAMDGWAAGMA